MRHLTRRRNPFVRPGFTLVEMLAASVVIAMVMVVLVQIAHSSARQARRALALKSSHPSVTILGEQIERDVRNADGIATVPKGVVLFGAIATHPQTGESTHRLARVTQPRVTGSHYCANAGQCIS